MARSPPSCWRVLAYFPGRGRRRGLRIQLSRYWPGRSGREGLPGRFDRNGLSRAVCPERSVQGGLSGAVRQGCPVWDGLAGMIRSGRPVQMICPGASVRDGRISQHPVYRIDRLSSVVFTEALPAVCRPEAAIYFPMGAAALLPLRILAAALLFVFAARCGQFFSGTAKSRWPDRRAYGVHYPPAG